LQPQSYFSDKGLRHVQLCCGCLIQRFVAIPHGNASCTYDLAQSAHTKTKSRIARASLPGAKAEEKHAKWRDRPRALNHIKSLSENMATQETHDQQPILLQSRDYSKLLDVIDLLRSQGVSQYVPLPQLIVCGDQSAGKSSVLEAVSGVRFPTKDTVCTRFATELILRRGLETSVTVGITPGKERSPEERAALSSFRVPGARIEDFPSLVDSAKEKMGLNNNTKAFSSDVLRVEVTGPNQTNLTLVDLPGLIHAENKQQSTDDVNMVYSLVKAYMAESRSIILAVVSAKNDYANQIVTKLARDVDPKGIRTLGIITKPDTLHVGSESERDFVNLAKNEDVTFRLGWHVLRNRDYDKRNSSAQERDDTERYFFSQGIWTTLPMNILGLDALKPRLSRVLRDQIISEFPRLIDDIKTGIGDCQNRLAKLGEAREGLQEQRRYLMQIGQSFTTLIKAAVGGVYSHEFFGSAKTTEGYSKRLRAVIQALLMDFADDMRRNGHDRKIVDDVDNNDGGDGDDDGDDNDENSGPTEIARDDYVSEVRTLMRRSRGCELPGTFNPLVIGDLFFQQARPWKDIVTNHCHKVLEASRLCVDFSLLHLTDDRTRAGLHREIVDPALERISEALEQKVLELMKPHQKGHPITYNRTFTETVQNAREEHRKRELQRRLRKFFKLKPGAYAGLQNVNVAELLNVLAKETKQDMELYACSEAADCMEAYYQVSLPLGDWMIVHNVSAAFCGGLCLTLSIFCHRWRW
jgi:GTPase SAR1 family protein